VCAVVDDGVEVAEQEHPAGAGAVESADHVVRVVRRGARHPLDLRLGRQERLGEGHALLGPVAVAGRRRDRHQRLQLALDHSIGAAKW
jgi:predicted component of type VI protein secretion system